MKPGSDYIFKETPDGSLELVGDFEGLYKNDVDPWGQSGRDVRLAEYYQFSRERLAAMLRFWWIEGHTLEVGCGLGYVTDYLNENVERTTIEGLDISAAAILRARGVFSKYRFSLGDIASPELTLPRQYEAIVMCQVLWYVMENMESVLRNCLLWMKPGGFLVFSQGFLKDEQRFGRSIIDGHRGLLDYMEHFWCDEGGFVLEMDSYKDDTEFPLHDGVMLYKRVI